MLENIEPARFDIKEEVRNTELKFNLGPDKVTKTTLPVLKTPQQKGREVATRMTFGVQSSANQMKSGTDSDIVIDD